MKKKAILCAVIFSLALTATFFAVGTGNNKAALAANIKQLEMYDSFDADSLNGDAWTVSGGADYREDYAALRISSIATWERHVSLQKTKLSSEWDDFSIEFDLGWFSPIAAISWTGIFFGMPSAQNTFGQAKHMLGLNASSDRIAPSTEGNTTGLRLTKKAAAGAAFLDRYGDEGRVYHPSPIMAAGNIASGGSMLRVKMDFTKNAPVDGSVSHSLVFRWGTNPDILNYVYDFPEIDIDGYMSFSTWTNTIAEIRNFKLTAEGEDVFSDDFRNTSLSVPSSPSPDANWRAVVLSQDEGKIYCGKFCSVGFDGAANGKLVYNTPVVKLNENSDKSFETSFDVKLNNITENTYIGAGLGLGSIDSAADSAAFIGFHKRSGTEYGFGIIKSGQRTAANDELVFASSALSVNIKFIGRYNGGVDVYVDNVLKGSFSGVSFDGYICAATHTVSGNAEESRTAIDNFYLYIFETVGADAEDAAINFKGAKEYESFGEIITEHYLNTKKWIMYGSGVKMPVQMSRAYLQFSNAQLDVGFGPKARYGDSIVRFDFCVTALPAPSEKQLAPLGLSFGRDYLDAVYNEAPGIFFSRENTGSTAEPNYITRIKGMNIKTTGGSEYVQSDINVFEDTSTWYTCLVIISHRTARLYLKKTADPDSAFGAPKVTFAEVNSYGYVALTLNTFNSYAGNYNITNFSVTSIDDIYGEA